MTGVEPANDTVECVLIQQVQSTFASREGLTPFAQ